MLRNLARHVRRLKASAAVLLAVFLAAGTSLPSLDAVLFHSEASRTDRWQTHVEEAGGCLDHAEHCGLGRSAPGSSAMAALAGAVNADPLQSSAPARISLQPQLCLHHSGIPQPRAPPVDLA